MKKLGIHVSNGTDCPVEKPDALRCIQCAVTRQPIAQDIAPYLPAEAFTVEEAIQSYTLESAYAAFAENHLGQIQPGFLADFVRLDANPFETDPQCLHKIKVKETWVGGTQVYTL
jgi:predicted amidohydrolase YtcJ